MLVTHDVALREIEIFGNKLQLEVGHDIASRLGDSSAQEEQVLTINISGLPSGISSPRFIEMSIYYYLMKAEIKTKSCDLVNGVAYVALEDPSSECVA